MRSRQLGLYAADMPHRGEDIRKHAAMTKLYYRMVRILTILEGTSDMQHLTVAERMLKETPAA